MATHEEMGTLRRALNLFFATRGNRLWGARIKDFTITSMSLKAVSLKVEVVKDFDVARDEEVIARSQFILDELCWNLYLHRGLLVEPRVELIDE